MNRTNSRKIRRQVARKNPLPYILFIVYVAAMGLGYVALQSKQQNLKYSLDKQGQAVEESEVRLRNLEGEVEKYTTRDFIKQKVHEFNLGLEDPDQGQIVRVWHFDPDKNDSRSNGGAAARSARATTASRN